MRRGGDFCAVASTACWLLPATAEPDQAARISTGFLCFRFGSLLPLILVDLLPRS
jgi:hypothetical protein